MTAVAHEVNRPWDGRRLLRFLTSLAILALAVTLRLSGPVAAPVALSGAAPAVVLSAAVPGAVLSAAVPAVAPSAAVPVHAAEQPERTDPPPASPVTVVPALRPAPATGVVPAPGDPRGPPTR